MDRKRLREFLCAIAGPLLLTALLLGGLLGSLLLSRHQECVSRQLEEAVWFSLSGRWEEARDLTGDARNSWQEYRKIQGIFADNSPMEEIDALFSQLEIYGAVEAGTEFGAVCAALSRQIQAMADAQKVSWWNIL